MGMPLGLSIAFMQPISKLPEIGENSLFDRLLFFSDVVLASRFTYILYKKTWIRYLLFVSKYLTITGIFF